MEIKFQNGISGKEPMLRFVHFSLCCLLISSPALAWKNHYGLTRAAIERSGIAEKAQVPYVTLAEALSKASLLGFSSHSVEAFRREVKIRKDYLFPTKLAEEPGKPALVHEILAHYSDEPDWGPDMELFSNDQYPELWTKDTPYVSGKSGLASQGFRHMFFSGKWDWREPLSSFQIPMRPLGEAPDRAVLFWRLSRAFFQAGQPYWGYRFLAWSLHFFEDMSQPFHIRQTPTKRLIVLKWQSLLPSLDVDATAEQISYYHLSYEAWVDAEFEKPATRLRQALKLNEILPPLQKSLIDFILEDYLRIASSRSKAIGEMAYHIFPAYQPVVGKRAEDFVGTTEWRSRISDHPEMPKLTEQTEAIFRGMAKAIRRVIEDATSLAPDPSGK